MITQMLISGCQERVWGDQVRQHERVDQVPAPAGGQEPQQPPQQPQDVGAGPGGGDGTPQQQHLPQHLRWQQQQIDRY